MKTRSLRHLHYVITLRTVFLGGIVALLVGNILVFLDRSSFLLACYPYFITEGSEGPPIYSIWKVQRGYPLYEWPHTGFYCVTFYNFGFYWLYATLLRLVGAFDEHLLVYGRALTVMFALIGAAIQAELVRQIWPRELRHACTRATTVAVSIVVWLGTNFAGWWPLSIRPDIPAAMLEALGLLLYVKARGRAAYGFLFAVSTALFMAWSVKQSAVYVLVGLAAYELALVRHWQRIALLSLPFTFGVVISLAIGGEVYWYNIIYVPTISDFHWLPIGTLFGRTFLQNILFWAGPVLTLFCLVHSTSSARAAGSPASSFVRGLMRMSEGERVLFAVYLVAFPLGLLALGRVGSNRNQLFIAYAMSSCLALGAWFKSRRLPPPQRSRLMLGLVIFTLMCSAFPFIQLLLPNQVGRTRLASPAEIDERRALVEYVRNARKPVLVADDILSLPWNSTANGYPALVLDIVYFKLATDKGYVKDGGIASLIRDKKFATLLLRDSELERVATESDYVVVARFTSSRGGYLIAYALEGGVTSWNRGCAFVVTDRTPGKSKVNGK